MKINCLFLIVLTVFLVSCAVNQLTLDKIKNIEKGWSSAQLNTILSPKTPRHEFSIEENGVNYFVQVYDMVTHTETYYGQAAKQGNSATVNYQFGNFTPPPPPNFNTMPRTSYTSVNTEPYAFIFYEDKLLFWGFFEELNKAENDEINKISTSIQAEYDRREEERKRLP